MGVIIDMQIWIRTTTSSIYSALSEVISDRQTGTSFGLYSVQRNGLETRERMEPPGLEPPTPHTARERAREAVVYLLPTTPALPGFVVRPQGSCLPHLPATITTISATFPHHSSQKGNPITTVCVNNNKHQLHNV